MRFWLRKGVDTFRGDVIGHLIKDDQFRDSPSNPPSIGAPLPFTRPLDLRSTMWLPKCDHPCSSRSHVAARRDPALGLR
ncbi:hypothetical protein [Bradyrhizobium sp. STM 3562]|uniref:hypothetical protein n=1 Tax=Bradyrhizobium sp. STM 3562 TaxID=578924 RepID=UPI003890DD65